MARSATLARVTDGRRAPHPANELNDLPGEEWLYFTKSVLTTAYPSELGHAARKACPPALRWCSTRQCRI